MACKVRYLNSAGIMPREIKGIDALSKAFPSNWLLYVSLKDSVQNSRKRGQSKEGSQRWMNP
ncbi:hypothetical protein [Ralstonia pseudosolanacearum]|uniref:hypothetical protein n=1 Tax=Ralstonia pseudosolanacearum TaxID=1310165 RepID=UPI000857B9B2|nr:hypothetical protein [Ralstonia pseudosolanacearum]AOE92218.1 hypothetical protein LBM341_03968 [Ralstonia solanacearum]NKA16300.1 serine/threonine protein kinase [Ralstonia solanacearum]NKA51309.1 serine/threonine protein kinase [Ralstonia solanacearum]UYR04447.1 hypothetical protein NQS37_17410 [Ralstonia pseudosolanacearum]UYR14397.1 hypothetical protein NQS35_17350 [Ralstonia pseudosolanacearum]